MAKPAVARLQESIAATRSFATDTPSADNLVRRLETWLDQKTEADLEALSGRLSLGGWHPMSGGPAKVLRDQRRGYLLLCELHGAAADREAVKRMDLAGMKTQAARFIGTYTAPVIATDYELAPSFQHATAAESDLVHTTMRAYRPLVQACVRHVSMAAHTRADRALFERWFGAFDRTRHQKVLNNFLAMSGSPKRIMLYYRGNGLPGRNEMDTTLGDEPVPAPNGPLVKLFKSDDAGYYLFNQTSIETDPAYAHVFLGRAFFGPNIARFTVPGQKASGVGVILHEVTHGICRTDDCTSRLGGIMYGLRLCADAALHEPDKAVKNADSYRSYATECENG